MRWSFLGLVLLILGCEQEVEVDLTKNFKPEIAVSSFFSPKDSIRVFVTLTQPAYSQKFKRVKISSAWLEDDFNHRYPLLIDEHFFDTDLLSSEIPDFTYGSAVRLVVESDDLDSRVTAVDTLPHPAYFKDFEVSPVKESIFIMWVDLLFRQLETVQKTFFMKLFCTVQSKSRKIKVEFSTNMIIRSLIII